MNAYQWKKAAAGIFFPRRLCINCGALSLEAALCPDCLGELRRLHRCARCASFIPDTETADYRCEDCRGEQPAFALARAALPYSGRLRAQLLAFKYRERTGLRRPLAEALLLACGELYAGCRFDAVLPAPLSAARLAGRGYNQAELLSGLLAAELGLPHRPQWLLRSRDTRPLAELSRAARLKELSGAFQAPGRVDGLNLLLIDDIFTTGATLDLCSRALVRAGAAAVYGLTVAAGHDL